MRFSLIKTQVLKDFSALEKADTRNSVGVSFWVVMQLYGHLSDDEEMEMKESKSTLEYIKGLIIDGRFDDANIDLDAAKNNASKKY